jgi:hypothetical protein
MDLQSAIIDRLGTGSATEAIVGARVSWRLRKQGSALPAVVLDTVSEERTQHLDGFDTMRTARVQAACLATTYGASRALAEAVIADLVGQPWLLTRAVTTSCSGRAASKARATLASKRKLKDSCTGRWSI